MFDDSHQRTFFSAPQTVTALIAALLEPCLIVASFIGSTLAFDQPFDRATVVLCLLVLALSFPGSNRFRDNLLGAAVDILYSWAMLLAILALCGWATRSFYLFDDDVLMTWAVVTPVLLWCVTWAGRTIIAQHAASPLSRRTAVVVGAGPLGVKVVKSLRESQRGVDFVGYFDDRTDDRLDDASRGSVLGSLSEVGAYVSAYGVREVYITLPLGSQPRIVELLDKLQGTTASLFFVPDIFGISIIQGRLQDMGGLRSWASARRRSPAPTCS